MVPDYFSEKNFQRRIKRMIKARLHRFVVKVPPAFAKLCAEEIAALGLSGTAKGDSAQTGSVKPASGPKRAGSAPVRTDSGIELTGSLTDMYSLNLKLQTASRVLMEISPVKAGAREELFRKTAKIPWELYLNPLLPLAVTARVRKSRLKHEGQTAATLREAIAKRFTGLGIAPPPLYSPGEKAKPEQQAENTKISGPEPPPLLEPTGKKPVHQRLGITVIGNKGRILMDTSGNHLHMRGYRERHGEAAIRETLAAGFIKWIFGSRQGTPAVIADPMCGSGTLLFESRFHFSGNPPGAKRDFLFTHLPWHQDRTWNHIRRSSLQSAGKSVPRLIGSDISHEAIEVARANCERNDGCGRNAILHEEIQSAETGSGGSDYQGDITFRTVDFLESGPELFGPAVPGDSEMFGLEQLDRIGTPGEKWIVSNPPYGVRLEAGTRRFLKSVIRHLRDRYAGWNAALILPSRFAGHHVIRNRSIQVESTIRFSNGGIPVMGVVLKL